MPVEFMCTTEEMVTGVTINPTTSSGQPATLDGDPTVTLVSGDGTTEDVDGQQLPNFLTGSTAGADIVFLVEADADLGEGVVTISDTVTLHVTAPQAKNLGLGGGTVQPKPV